MEEFWALSLSGISVCGATQALAEKRAQEIEQPYQEFDSEEIDPKLLAMYDEDLAACRRKNDKRSSH